MTIALQIRIRARSGEAHSRTPEWGRRLPPGIQQVALRKLRMLNRAMTLEDLRIPPANRHADEPEPESAGSGHRRAGSPD